MGDSRWLFWICLSRLGFALINTAYAAQIPALRVLWDMSASQAGLVQSAWHGGYIVSLVAASALAGRWGTKRTFLAMGYAACVGTLLFALWATSFSSAFALYGLAGLCAGGSYIPGLALIAERFPPAGRGRAMGFYIAAASLGYALGLVGSSLAAGLAGPRAGFLVAAMATVAGQAVALLSLHGTPNVIAGTTAVSSLDSLRWLWSNKPARLVILMYGFHAWELLGMWAWLPAFLSAAMLKHPAPAVLLAASGTSLAALTHLSSMAGSMAGGALSDVYGRSRVILCLSLISLSCSLLFGWLMAVPVWLLIGVAILFNCAAIGDSAIFTAALTEVVPPRHLGTAYSIRSVVGYGMGALSPWLMGVVLDLTGNYTGITSDTGWGWAWTALGLVGLVGPLLTVRLQSLQKKVLPEGVPEG